MLIRAVYHGINFHQPVPPGKSDVEVAISSPPGSKSIAVTTRVVFFQPNGATLIVAKNILSRTTPNAGRLFSRRRKFRILPS